MINICDLTLEELKELLRKRGQEAFHAQQVFSWIYKKAATDFEMMSDLSSGLRKQLKEDFYLLSLKPVKLDKSLDGTEKSLLELKDASLIETVLIPAENRITGCVSTQVGCKFNCGFCASGVSGFKRNLASGEIVEEALYLKNRSQGGKLTHLVFMGMGEPLDNCENVIKAIRIINSPEALRIGARRITISTCGLIPGIKRLSDEGLQVELSISLHAADDQTRSQIMPVNKKYPVKELIKACAEYIKKTNRQVTFEYILINGINSDLRSAARLSDILNGLNCKVNLIPSNPIKELGMEPPSKLAILLFRDYLLKQGVNVTLRKPRGRDIEAACGQLRLRYGKK
ncbi:MAG: 23S rRNA (adenine(2503)-C(2))-methyltransferase RlmN [Candidatus Omnitrophota bacterium]